MTNRDSGKADSSAGRSRTWAWIVSSLAHATLVAFALVVVWSVAPEQRTREAPDMVSFDAPAPPPLETTESSETEHGDISIRIEPAPTESVESLLERTAEDIALVELAAPPPAPTPAPTMSAAPPAEIDFAGVGASEARSIVYVVDASGSMLTTLEDTFRELRRSVDQLHPTQRFQVLLVQNTKGGATHLRAPIPPGARDLVLASATRRNKSALYKWLDKVDAAGRSDPIGALEAALALEPDAVFVLSTRLTGADDTDVRADHVLARLEALNPANNRAKRPAAIKTIAILEEDPTGLLKAIGLTHGGPDGYNFIDRAAFNRGDFGRDGATNSGGAGR